jgi:hypothetical protein
MSKPGYHETLVNRITRYVLIGLLMIAFPYLRVMEIIIRALNMDRNWHNKEGLFWCSIGALVMSLTTIAAAIFLLVKIFH